jgi:SAM-dependent methyltransferase
VGTATATLPYALKESPYSSHSILLRMLPYDGTGKRVLDIGCATGYLSGLLAQRGFEVTGIERPGFCGADFPAGVRLVEADLESGMPPLSGLYDYILLADILEHLRDPRSLLAQLRHVLNSGGVIIASLPNSGNIWFRLNILAGRFPQDDKGLFDRTHLHFYMWRGWEDLFRSAGFSFEQARVTGIPVGLMFQSIQGSPPVKAAEAAAYGFALLWRKLFAYQFVVAARAEVQ